MSASHGEISFKQTDLPKMINGKLLSGPPSFPDIAGHCYATVCYRFLSTSIVYGPGAHHTHQQYQCFLHLELFDYAFIVCFNLETKDQGTEYCANRQEHRADSAAFKRTFGQQRHRNIRFRLSCSHEFCSQRMNLKAICEAQVLALQIHANPQ